MKQIYFIFLIVILFASCRNKELVESPVVILGLDSAVLADTFYIEDNFECKMISFTNNNDIFLDEIDYVSLSDKLYIYESYNSGRLFVCDINGSNLKEITRKGKGPGEYPFISSVYIDKKIYVKIDKVLNIYDINNKFIAQIESPKIRSRQFVVKDNWMYNSNNWNNSKNSNTELSIFNLKNNETKELLPFVEMAKDEPDKSKYIWGQFLTINEEGEILYSRLFENIIYQLEGDKMNVKYKIKINKNDSYIISGEQQFADSRPKITMASFFESANNLYINLYEEYSKPIAVYNKRSKTFVKYNQIMSKELGTSLELDKTSNGILFGRITSSQVKFLIDNAHRILLQSNPDSKSVEWANNIIQFTGDQVQPILFILKEYKK